jgi:hypothetical protein
MIITLLCHKNHNHGIWNENHWWVLKFFWDSWWDVTLRLGEDEGRLVLPNPLSNISTSIQNVKYHFHWFNQCWVVLKMRDIYLLVVNLNIYTFILWFSKFSNNRFWYITTIFKKKSKNWLKKTIDSLWIFSWKLLIFWGFSNNWNQHFSDFESFSNNQN